MRDVSERVNAEELLERSAEGLSVLYEISSAFLSPEDFTASLERALSLIGEYYQADLLVVSVPDKEGTCFQLLGSSGWDGALPSGEAFQITREYMSGHSFLERQPVIVYDFGQEERFALPEVYRLHGVVSGISVPMVAEDTAIGVLSVLFKGAMPFKTSELWYLSVVANSLAVFIQKERSLEKVKESESFLYSVLEGIGQGVVVIDRDMKIVKVNQGFLRLMGMSIEEVLGNTCHEVSHGSSKPCHLNGEVCTVKTVFETGLPQSALHAHSAKDGTPLHVQTVAYPIHDASGRVVAAVETVTDLTDRVKLEKDLEKRVKELEEFYDMAVGRELRMIELKEEIAHLREELARHKK
jgi:PAS domain S-box-containing protein